MIKGIQIMAPINHDSNQTMMVTTKDAPALNYEEDG
jgi:hypothetical protein